MISFDIICTCLETWLSLEDLMTFLMTMFVVILDNITYVLICVSL